MKGNEDSEARVHIVVTGHVQGVLFRKSLMDLSRSLGVTGWVRNLTEGRVEAVAEGRKAKLDQLVEFCHVGPSGARVTNVVVQWSEFRGEFFGFRITR